jgi:hypothetical protein
VRERVEIPCPEAVVNNTQNIGALTFLIRNENIIFSADHQKEWWKYLFRFVINVYIVNSFIFFHVSNRPQNTVHGNRLQKKSRSINGRRFQTAEARRVET